MESNLILERNKNQNLFVIHNIFYYKFFIQVI